MPKAIFLGNVTHETLARLYASSDVFVFPSISEAYGNVVIEAMCCALPCVIGQGGGSSDFIENDVNGFVCSPNNENEYVCRIIQILQEDDTKRRISENAVLAGKRLSWSELTNTYLNDLTEMNKKQLL